MEDSLPLFAFESLKFTNAGRIIFASEKDGRNHLYSIAATCGAPQLLTPGNFDVEEVMLSADKRSVLYTSNQNDVDRRRRKTIHSRHAAPTPTGFARLSCFRDVHLASTTATDIISFPKGECARHARGTDARSPT
jgi:hypothetical protein